MIEFDNHDLSIISESLEKRLQSVKYLSNHSKTPASMKVKFEIRGKEIINLILRIDEYKTRSRLE